MNNTLLSITYLFLAFLLSSCMAQKNISALGELKGSIGIYEGNCMPGPGREPCIPKPTSTTIYISELSKNYAPNLVIDSTRSDDEGNYSIRLKPGTYSLFLKDRNSVICDLLQCPSQCFCQPFKISSDSTTVIDANLDHASW